MLGSFSAVWGDKMRRSGRVRGLSVVLLALLLMGSLFNQVTRADSAPPNVLMICVDDLNDWVGFLGGHPQTQTPHLDRLAARSRVFVNAHCAVPVCSPSRISVMSGLHATSHGSYELGPSYQSIFRLERMPTIQAYFKSHGYLTFVGGKVLHHGFTDHLKDDVDFPLLKSQGGPRPEQLLNWPVKAWDWGAFPERTDQMDDYRLAQQAAERLQDPMPRPFFMTVGFFRPHVPMYVPPEWYARFEESSVVLPQVPAGDLDDVPDRFKNMPQIAPTHREVVEAKKWQALVQAYLASVAFVDHCIGHLLTGLESSPHAKNTIVVLWSDHGFHLGEKEHWAKRTLWEESTRVPLLFAGPDIVPGEPCREAVSLVDIYPTLIELCGLNERKNLDGISLVPQLENPRTERKVPVQISSFEGNHAIRSRDWKLIHYADGSEELYDHRNDPQEIKNLIRQPTAESNTIRQKLAAYLPKQAAPEVMSPENQTKFKD